MTKPWLTDPMFGGMSEESARLSYQAWERQGFKPLQFKTDPLPPASEAEIEMHKARVEACLKDIEQAIAEAKAWGIQWRAKQRSRGFKFMEEG